MGVLGWCLIACGVVALLIAAEFWVSAPIRAVHRKSRPSASGGGKSAGYARGSRTPRAAEAEGNALPEAADTVPDGGGLLPSPPSGTTAEWAWGFKRDGWIRGWDSLPVGSRDNAVLWCAIKGDWHDYRCTEPERHHGVHRAVLYGRVIAQWSDPIARHIDTAAALLQPDKDFTGWAADVDAWVAAGCPAVWPIPVVPGGES